ncbi:MAG: DUF1272 domain-containing protein [Burkholderiaceae bacterium]
MKLNARTRPTCEYRNTSLPPDSLEARICSFECSFSARKAVIANYYSFNSCSCNKYAG